MGKELDLTIIVPVYNKENYICACMDSLLAGLPERAEILLIDDGSTDSSPQLCEAFGQDARVRVIHQENRGLAQVRNLGVSLARGAYIGFCDGDDYVHPQMFAKLLYAARRHDADLAVCGYLRTPDRSSALPSSKGYPVCQLSGGEAFSRLVAGQEPLKSYAWNKLVRASLYEGIEYPAGRLYEDQFTTYRLVDRARTVLVTDWPAYCYVDAPDSITNAPWKPEELDYIDAWREIVNYCEEKHPECWQTAKDQLVSASAYSYSRFLRSGQRDPESEAFLREQIMRYGEGYVSSSLNTATPRRKLFVESVRLSGFLPASTSGEELPKEGIYVEMSGRLGNQMFRYAFARWLLEKGGVSEPLILDFSNIEQERKKGEMEGWEDSLRHFRVLPYSLDESGRKALDRLTTPAERAALAAMKAAEYPLKQKGTNARLAFHKKLLPWLNRHGLYLLFVGYDYPFTWAKGIRKVVSGPFECARYPEEIRDILLREFVPRQDPLPQNLELLEKIRSTNSVCVTVRRGNYLQYSALNVCTPSYFERAAQEMARLVENPVFFVFSDDIQWTKGLKLPGEVYYESGTDPVWEKLRLMYSCRHFIISNSTFSWWAQFLGQAPDKQVIAPDHWFNGEYQPPLQEAGWHYVEA